jgi:hypothetical protein
MGRIVPECDDPQIRGLLQRSYRVIYRLQENTVEILTIYHGAKVRSFELVVVSDRHRSRDLAPGLVVF